MVTIAPARPQAPALTGTEKAAMVGLTEIQLAELMTLLAEDPRPGGGCSWCAYYAAMETGAR